MYQATTKSLIEGVISGYNATVFAYGPTGEGECPQGSSPSPSTSVLVWPRMEQELRTWRIETAQIGRAHV